MPKNSAKKFLPIFLFIFFGILVIVALVWLSFSKFLDKVSFENKDTLNYKDASVEVSLNQKSLPNDFPSDFPIYPNAQITSSWKSGQGEADGFSIVLETTDSIEMITSFFNTELAKKGWTVEKGIKEKNSQTLSFNKGASKGFIGLVENAGRVIISLTVATPK